MINVLVIENGVLSERLVNNNHKSFNEIVGGRIEYAYFRGGENKFYDIILNDEGKLLNLPISAILNIGGTIDTLHGNLIISKADEKGDQVSLTRNEITMFKQYINTFKDKGVPVFYY